MTVRCARSWRYPRGQGACAASTSAAAAITADATAASRLTPLLGVRDTPSLAVGR